MLLHLPTFFYAIYTETFLKKGTFLIGADMFSEDKMEREIGSLTSNHRDVFMVEIIAVPD